CRHAQSSPAAPPFPYTTLFRSVGGLEGLLPHPLGLLEQPRDGGAADRVGFVEAQAHFAALGPRHVGVGEVVEGETIVREQPHLEDRKSTRLNSSHRTISYAVFC